mmetsp:Transcript_29030/g.52740  ORF Transcript_29030/g.52740 Transcript_29030/m.52740 type:complete len:594 (-) Transcript_29030:152-1933(-)
MIPAVAEGAARQWYPPHASPVNTRQRHFKPVSTDQPLKKSYQGERSNAEYAARRAAVQKAKVSRQTEDRLAVAEARHRQVLAGIEREADATGSVLHVHTRSHEREGNRLEAVAQESVAKTEALDREQQELEAQHIETRREGLERVARLRQHTEEHTQNIDRDIQEIRASADEALENSRAEARAKLADLSQQRAEIHENCRSNMDRRHKACEALQSSLDVSSHLQVVKSEVTRQRAAVAVDYAGAVSQATKTISQERVLRNEAKAEEQARDLALNGHQLQDEVASSLKQRLRRNFVDLQAAHDYCAEVKIALASDTTQYKRRMRQIDTEAASAAREEERKVIAQDQDRLAVFKQAHRHVENCEENFQARRMECEGEHDEIHQRLRQVERDTRARADQILAQWVADSEKAEQTIRNLEEKGRKAIEAMQAAVNDEIRQLGERNAAAQENGATAVASLERQANEVVNSTQPALEAARCADEEAAARALATLRDIKKRPEEIRATADAKIDAKMEEARLEEERLKQEAEARIAAFRAETKASAREEKQLQEETAQAWTRLRSACYQLRLVNLHDFAQGIVDGNFDLPLVPEYANVEF